MSYSNLFSPFWLGGIELKNRLVMSPMTMNYATEAGLVTQKLIDYYVERAKGGVGLIMVEGTFFEPAGRGYRNQLGISSEEHTESLKSFTQAVRDHGDGIRCFLQIHHAGWRASSKITNHRPVAPSPIPPYPGAEVPHELSIAEIRTLIRSHARAAARAKDAGFDGVDIHCAHGYLVPSFLSPLSNRRTDEYGGDISGRTRFLVETIRAIRSELGQAFPVTIKISGDEFMQGGLDATDMIQIALIAQDEGVAGVTISAGGVGGAKIGDLSRAHQILRTLPMMTERACLAPLAARFTERLKVPVTAVGRIHSADLADRLIAEGCCDLVAMGRPLLADPHLPRKAMQGAESSIRPCISCNEGCYKRIFEQKDIRCSVNPVLGKEKAACDRKADRGGKIVVIGGGPAGMEAAYWCRSRDHRVTLLEKEDRCGGQLNIAAVPPGRGEIHNFTRYQIRRLQQTGVDLQLGRPATIENVKALVPDAVILATGSRPCLPEVCGHITARCLTAWEALAEGAKVPSPVLIMGAGLVGCETADYLAELGKEVHLLDVLPEIATGSDADTKSYFTMKFADSGVTVYTGTAVDRFEESTAVIITDGVESRIPCIALVYAAGAQPVDDLADGLSQLGINVYKIGDCREPRNILNAVQEGYEVAGTIKI